LGLVNGHGKAELDGELTARENKAKIGHFRVAQNAWQGGTPTLILTGGNLDLQL
jgi:hypothetical protein